MKKRSAYDWLFDVCCRIAVFILQPTVRWTIRLLTGILVVLGAILIARATLVTHTLGLGGALLACAVLALVGVLGLKED